MKWFLVKVMSNRYVQAFMQHPQSADVLAFAVVRIMSL